MHSYFQQIFPLPLELAAGLRARAALIKSQLNQLESEESPNSKEHASTLSLVPVWRGVIREMHCLHSINEAKFAGSDFCSKLNLMRPIADAKNCFKSLA